MCMLTFLPENVVPTDYTGIHNGIEFNTDGHGFAIVAGNRLIVRKSMNGVELLAEFAEMRAQHSKGPALFHSRITTAGTTDVENCHPFAFGGDKRTVVAHNGILPRDAQPDKKDRRSDTRLAADCIFPKRFGHLGHWQNRERLAKWAGTYNKLVILTVNPAYAERSYIVNEHMGYWDDGLWYSNTDYRGWEQYRTGKYTAGGLGGLRRWDDEEDDINDGKCGFCGDLGTIDHYGYCLNCTTCVDCGDVEENCECYCPSGSERSSSGVMVSEDDFAKAYKKWWEDTKPASLPVK